MRSSDNKVLGVVSDKYRIVQNADAFAFTDALIGGDVHYETAGSLLDGKKIWLLAKLPDSEICGDKTEPYVCFSNTHDGSGAVRVCMTPVRVVCNNTLNLALNTAQRAWSVRHVGDISTKLVEAQQCLEMAGKYMDALAERADQMANTTVSDERLRKILDELFPEADDIHLIAGVSTATARLNILDCDGFGLKNYFEGRCREGTYQNRDCLYIQTATGEKVVLVSGGGKAGDEKLIKGNTYGTAYITEANECSETFIKEVFDRTLSSPDRKVFHDLNPKAEGHWYYENILNLHEKKQNENPEYGFNYGHFTIADNMSISDDQLRAVLATYDRSTVWYARDILGKRKAAEGLVYPFFSAGQDTYLFHGDASHIDGQFYVSIDYGTHNPCSMGLWVIHDGKALRIKESFFDSRAERVQRTDEEHYAELERLTKGYYIQAVVVDPSAASFIETIRRHGKYLVIPADNDVLNGIRCVASLMQAGLVTIHESCTASRREFGLYSWDDKAKEDRVVKENDHAMDDIRYFCYTILAPLIRWADWRRK